MESSRVFLLRPTTLSCPSSSPLSMNCLNLSTSESFTGFTRKSSAPSSRHLSIEQRKHKALHRWCIVFQKHNIRLLSFTQPICRMKLFRPLLRYCECAYIFRQSLVYHTGNSSYTYIQQTQSPSP